MKKLILISTFIALQILVLQQPVFAIKEEKSQTKEQQCNQIRERISNRVSAYEANRNGKETVYANLLTKISEVILKLKDQGYDVTKLEADLTTLNSKVEKYWTDRQEVTNRLESSKVYACSESKNQYKEMLKQSKDSFEVVQADIKDIRLFVSQIIRSDIQALKSQRLEKEVNNESL